MMIHMWYDGVMGPMGIEAKYKRGLENSMVLTMWRLGIISTGEYNEFNKIMQAYDYEWRGWI